MTIEDLLDLVAAELALEQRDHPDRGDCIKCHGARVVYDDFENGKLPCDVCREDVEVAMYDDFEATVWDGNDHPLLPFTEVC